MITEIGITAGEIWHFLDKHGSVDFEQLASGIDKPKELVLMSLGWLAREGHVLVESEIKAYKISLRPKNK
ncbi:MAG: winged helix-turn-helix domain-containing protein [Candidatus Omnitrophica bacterium]|nr:winged helix-turn-helix domain-containing protein [Candidatus Omnitrophota bacterium]MBU2043839.1 winged helix-turn-helix domain-containing protein [Candidatus Omnitrophota bacterium]MBU2251361.1 winged helix-turn-helix domain-containing protein [Candidatus Omnitrophota bacterium]MBU2266270.1 winged helix-turn-helix domain-containing protein [Candidatus Omnitrophota bacterium]MBU2473806.1 winged helix-turn-helix domain-containing protein [Candidatus Omnitrophota bacterium]